MFEMYSNVVAVLTGPDGQVRQVERACNLVTTAGFWHVADQLASVPDEAVMSRMAIGTGNTAVVLGDTELDTELDRNVLTSRTQGGTGQEHRVIYVGDWAAGDGTGTIVEAGLFNAATAGTMLARVVFAPIVKASGDTLQITWKVTVSGPA